MFVVCFLEGGGMNGFVLFILVGFYMVVDVDCIGWVVFGFD